jgi:hypothetical protein
VIILCSLFILIIPSLQSPHSVIEIPKMTSKASELVYFGVEIV